MGVLSKLNRARKKATKKVLNPFVKGLSKISDKFLPNELRWAAPYAAGIGTLMLPPGMGPLYRALAAGGMNIAGQVASDETPIEDISDLNALSVALAGGLGALGSDQVSGAMRSGIEGGLPEGMSPGESMARWGTPDGPPVGFMQGAENIGREGIAAASDYITGGRETLANLGKNPKELMSLAGVKDAASALGPTISQGTGDVFREAAIDYRDEADRIRAEEEAEIAATTTANEGERANLQMTFMRQAGHDEETIQETLEMNDLGEYYTPPPPTELAAQGGIIGRTPFSRGGVGRAMLNVSRVMDDAPSGLVDESGQKLTYKPSTVVDETITEKIIKDPTETMRPGMIDAEAGMEPKIAAKFIEDIRDPRTGGIDYKKAERKLDTKLKGTESLSQLVSMYLYNIRKDKLGIALIGAGYGGLGAGAMINEGGLKEGGIIGLKHGGMLNFGGREMDLRGGGFVPIGRKERADDVPARLSKNEFVMTADAVRAAGGGDVNKGAQRMYNVMNNLEARA